MGIKGYVYCCHWRPRKPCVPCANPQPRIYKEIGPGKRIALTKLAIDHLEQTGQPLKIAIDVAIWQFQLQAARGGSNPAIRTLFYRLLRLLSLHIQPVFVFDGPNKPVFKRNKRSGRGDGMASAMAKRLIRLFGFLAHDAPGEAEAECALLQQKGVVDAVLSEDVDTIMFGCTKTLRNWSSECKGNTPTHMSMYDTAEMRQGESGLDREGMVLVALMSGGDYLPEGIPGAGVKLACEAARAGFGKSVCRLKRSDVAGMEEWRSNLKHELVTNESRFFRTKHKALNVPEDFPNLDILRYYTHPVVSPESVLEKLRTQSWDKPMDILGLRGFVGETFDWSFQDGAIKFIRVLAPCLLVRKIMQLNDPDANRTRDVEELQERESTLVRAITNRREHFSTDATPELRISFTPTDIVGYNFEEEPKEDIQFGREGLALNSDDEFEAGDGEESVAKPGARKPFNPLEQDLLWLPETIAKLGLPLMVEDWEEAQRAKAAKKSKAIVPKPKTRAKLGGMQVGSLDKFVKVSKNLPTSNKTFATSQLDKQEWPVRSRGPLGVLAPTSPKQSVPPPASIHIQKPARTPSAFGKQPNKSKKSLSKSQAAPSDATVNPWSIASSLSPSKQKSVAATAAVKSAEAILISSSPPTSPFKASHQYIRRKPSQSPIAHGAKDGTKSLQKRRSASPPDSSQRTSSSVSQSRSTSPTPQSGTRSRRKLARTESMPTESPRGAKNQDVFGTRRAPLARARTVAVEPQLADSEDSNDDFDLPPLSAFGGRIPRAPSPSPSAPTSLHDSSRALQDTSTSITIESSPLPPPSPALSYANAPPLARSKPPISATLAAPTTKAVATARKQSKLSEAFGMRTTKMYVPRKSEPGFFKEVEVTVAEADRLSSVMEKKSSRKWRQSDVSVIDLTGDGL